MLRNTDGMKSSASRSHRAWRVLVAVGLTTLTLAVATIRTPARGEDHAPATKALASSAPRFFCDDLSGAVVIRPAAALKHPGVDPLSRLLDQSVDAFTDALHLSKKSTLRLDPKNIDWATCSLSFGRGSNPKGKALHTMQFGGLTIRTVRPFDWLAFARQCGFETTAANAAGRVYYRIAGPLKGILGKSPCLYLADDQTVWFEEESRLKAYLSRVNHSAPTFLTRPEWERACQGLVAVALDNHDGSFTKGYDLGRPDDAVVLAIFKDVDRVTLAVDDADQMGLRVSADCHPGDASAGLARSIETYVKMCLALIDQPVPTDHEEDSHDPIIRMTKSLLSNVRVEHTDRSVTVKTQGFGRLSDLASMVEAEMKCKKKAGNQQAKAASKTATK